MQEMFNITELRRYNPAAFVETIKNIKEQELVFDEFGHNEIIDTLKTLYKLVGVTPSEFFIFLDCAKDCYCKLDWWEQGDWTGGSAWNWLTDKLGSYNAICGKGSDTTYMSYIKHALYEDKASLKYVLENLAHVAGRSCEVETAWINSERNIVEKCLVQGFTFTKDGLITYNGREIVYCNASCKAACSLKYTEEVRKKNPHANVVDFSGDCSNYDCGEEE